MFLMSKVMVSSLRMQQQSLEHQVIKLSKATQKRDDPNKHYGVRVWPMICTCCLSLRLSKGKGRPICS